jgi:hypothetical protein
MLLFIVLAVLLPWSLWRQMHAHEVTRRGLTKLPVIFAAVGLLGLQRSDIPTTGAAMAAAAFSLALSVGLGAARGALIPVWRDPRGRSLSQGNRLTIALWIVLIAAKFALGGLASVTGWYPQTSAGEVFLFLAISFAAQNLVLARRALHLRQEPGARAGSPARGRAVRRGAG